MLYIATHRARSVLRMSSCQVMMQHVSKVAHLTPARSSLVACFFWYLSLLSVQTMLTVLHHCKWVLSRVCLLACTWFYALFYLSVLDIIYYREFDSNLIWKVFSLFFTWEESKIFGISSSVAYKTIQSISGNMQVWCSVLDWRPIFHCIPETMWLSKKCVTMIIILLVK